MQASYFYSFFKSLVLEIYLELAMSLLAAFECGPWEVTRPFNEGRESMVDMCELWEIWLKLPLFYSPEAATWILR